jgi:hypothetical protein
VLKKLLTNLKTPKAFGSVYLSHILQGGAIAIFVMYSKCMGCGASHNTPSRLRRSHFVKLLVKPHQGDQHKFSKERFEKSFKN